MDLTAMLRPERAAQPPRTDAIEREDRERERLVEDRRRQAPPEPFDSHLGKVLPPGWSAVSEEQWRAGTMGAIALDQLVTSVPNWVTPGSDENAPVSEPTVPSNLSVHVVPVRVQETVFHADEVMESLRKGAPIQDAHFPTAVLVQAQQMVQRGEPLTRLSVQVAPEHLGAVQLTVELQGQGVSVHMRAGNEAAREALEGRSEEIRAILVAHGFKAQGLRVELASPRGQHGGNGHGEGPASQRFPNRWLLRRRGDLDEAIDVAVG